MIKNRFAFVIPVYNHSQDVRQVVMGVLKYNIPVFVVDDGSTDAIQSRLSDIKDIIFLKHDANLGKGAALITGFRAAVKVADWVITIDADCQHNPADARQMMNALSDGKRSILLGLREGMLEPEVPWTSRAGRNLSNFWVYMAGGPQVKDSQSGFRIYPLPECLNLNVSTRRFQFEVEILVKAGWKNVPVKEIPVSVHYQPAAERISHFRPVVDFLRNSATFTRLVVQRIVLPPSLRR